MKKSGFIVGAIAFCVIAFISFNVCAGSSTTTLNVVGSTTLQPAITECAVNYQNSTGVNVLVSGGGSGAGISALESGTCDIAMSSKPLAASDYAVDSYLNETPVALDGITMIVNTANTITQLNFTQIADIYNGTITNWNQVGGSNLPIVLIGRESTSGTLSFFTGTVMGSLKISSAMLAETSNAAVQTEVNTTAGAIGFVGMGFTGGCKEIAVANSTSGYVLPTNATVSTFTYPISRFLYLIVNGTGSPAANAFIQYVLSPEGQAVIVSNGFINIAPLGTVPTESGYIDGYGVVGLIAILGITSLLLIKNKIHSQKQH
jgi:phosphate transport system substrate-binding protein